MGKKKEPDVKIHVSGDLGVLTDELNAFYVSAVSRRLNEWDLTAERKIAIIDEVIRNLTAREQKGKSG